MQNNPFASAVLPLNSCLVSGPWLASSMSILYTKNGRPLRREGDRLYSRSGIYIGKIYEDRVYHSNGDYAATIIGDRVVYRATHSARIKGPSISANRVGIAVADRVPSAIWGDEPNFPS